MKQLSAISYQPSARHEEDGQYRSSSDMDAIIRLVSCELSAEC